MPITKPDYLNPEYCFSSKLNAGLIDELPLWSAPFGMKILDMIDYAKSIKAMDIGFGSGFPLIELAQRLGNTSVVYGIDPWKPSHIRTKQKIDFFNIRNVLLLYCGAEKIPLGSGTIDLVVSNNGINNVQDAESAFSEIGRVCRKGASFIASMNTGGTMKKFYEIFISVLNEENLSGTVPLVKEHIRNKRKPMKEMKSLFIRNGFDIVYVYKSSFSIKFADAGSFLNHSLIKIGFLDSWLKLIPPGKISLIIKKIKNELNKDVIRYGNIKMNIPYAVIKSVKN
jgi:ubiquinone/menaquinone biosynthesis C-methylase UbiE